MRQDGDVGEAPRPDPRQLSGTLADPIYLSPDDEVLVDSPDEGKHQAQNKGPGSEITIKQRHAALLAARRGIRSVHDPASWIKNEMLKSGKEDAHANV